VTEYRFEALADLGAPSEPTVFCLVMGTKPDDVEDAEFLVDGASMVVTDIRICRTALQRLGFIQY
jgi:hypothetical protein